MENSIHFSPEALSDLDEIWDYISRTLSNPISAEKTVNGILEKIKPLELFPQTGKPLEFNGISTIYRFVQYKNYLAFYHTNGNNVFIDRIIYGKRNYLNLLFSNLFNEID